MHHGGSALISFDYRLILQLVLVFFLMGAPAFAETGKCERDPSFYEKENYSIKAVRVDTPLGWLFGSVEEEIQAVLESPDMPIKKGDAFHKDAFNRSFEVLVRQFPELTVSRFDRIRVRISKPGLADCDSTSRSLTVVYHVYTFGFSEYLTRAFETGRKDELKRSVVDTPATKTLADLLPQPFAGYNRSRAIFAGGSISPKLPDKYFDTLSFEGSGSSSSAVARAEGSGAVDRGSGLIRHSDYQFRYFYSNLPGDSIRLKQGYGLGQFIAASKPFGSTELVIRFGALIEGGNKLADVPPGQVLPNDLTSTTFGSLKTFVGANLRIGERAQPLKFSYGLQLGSAGPGLHLDYTKQIFDSAANLSFRIGDHRTFNADLQFTAGTIRTRHELPVAERFFGGNAEQNFSASDSFVIRSNPVIRSLPQNQLDRNVVNGILGGDGFFSTNVTLAATLWRKPLVPSEIVDDDFNTAAEIGLNFAESTLKTEHLKETKEFGQMVAGIEPLAAAVKSLEAELDAIDVGRLGSNTKDQLELLRSELANVNQTTNTIRQDANEGSPKTGDIRKLVLGFPAVPVDSEVTTVVLDARKLMTMEVLPPNHLEPAIANLEGARKALADRFTALMQSPVERNAEAAAKKDMVYPRRVFYQLVNEANLIAVSPVALFDVARLTQREGSAGKVHIGVGPGVRLTIVSLDFTTGFAWNVRRQPWEGRGAFVITIQASNLFR